ncbi:MAG: sulfatase-like hydrolase/transferase [Akkermansiaceae bacterium]|nr:sulfatase-like hydrolase/transferase [Akkermansiaceae bacterium]
MFILTDDQGYGDLGCFGAKNIAIPNIDRLCNEGMKFTSFYVTNRCSPSRLAFMTGSLPERAGWSKGILLFRQLSGPDQTESVLSLFRQHGGTCTERDRITANGSI